MENKVKIWGKEVERCFICTYYNGYEGCCNITGEYIDPISNDNINNKCPFLKPITKEVIEGFGFKYIKPWISLGDGAIYVNNLYGLTHFYKTDSISIWESLQYNLEGDIYFNGKINNPIELEFILKSIGVIE